ncbi:MAG: hypothetical protein IPP07_05720 [Holophagales bacterium]|nr:hypothetical protein [Holophagales bacterium]MBK9964410.1 hypothetical protein [Holophagales bacterium]
MSGRKPIGEILVGAGVISVETRDRVLDYQEWNHVSFGTALLESGELSEQLFLRALSVQHSVPGASASDLESIPADILVLVKRRIAERCSVIPFRKVGRTLHVAMTRPNDEVAIRSIALLTGLTVVPHVAIAVRVALAIEKHYGVPAASHFKALARILGEVPAAAPREAPAARAALALPNSVPGTQAPRSPADLRAGEPVAERSPAPPPWQELTQSLCDARNPDQVSIALLDFLSETVGPAALYRVRGNEAVLWKARLAAAEVPSLSIPFAAGSLFASLRDAADVFAGLCPDNPENRQIVASLGGCLPESVVVVPVNLNERTILYIVGRPGSGRPSLDRSSLGRLAKITATALGLVALHRRLLSL